MKSLLRFLAMLPLGFVRRRVFTRAIKNGEQDLALRLFNRLGRLDFTDSWDWPIEHVVADHGNLEILKLLFDKRPDLDINSDAHHASLLHCAVRSGNIECVEWLLGRGADLEAKALRGKTPLHWAAEESLATCRVLVDAGAEIDAGRNEFGTPLASAAFHPDTAAYLIEQGADPNAADAGGRTPLMKAQEVAVVEILLKAGADVHGTDNEGRDALSHAISSDADVIRVLVDAGADVNRRDNNGGTPLGRAIGSHAQEYPVAVRALLAHGADVEDPIFPNQTPLAVACLTAQLPVIPILLEAGADPNATTTSGETVLDLLRKTDKPSYMSAKFKEVENMLVAAGARSGH